MQLWCATFMSPCGKLERFTPDSRLSLPRNCHRLLAQQPLLAQHAGYPGSMSLCIAACPTLNFLCHATLCASSRCCAYLGDEVHEALLCVLHCGRVQAPEGWCQLTDNSSTPMSDLQRLVQLQSHT